MDKTIAQLLGEGTLPEELVASLQEAFDRKVAEAREDAEVSIREEMARRYEHDKETFVEAMDRMLTDAVQKFEDEKAVEVRRFVEARNKFRRGVNEARTTYKSKIAEHTTASRKFVTEQLVKEIGKLREQKKALTAERLRVAETLETERKALAEQQVARLKKIDEFVVRQVTKELKEFSEDHRALVETRAKLVAEGRRRLKEAQTRFVKESAKRVEKAINETLKRELTQLHEDLERNRQNMFGRRIFEAVAAEFMTSYLAEGTEIRKLQKVVETKEKELHSVKNKLSETEKNSEVAQRKAKLAEDRAARAKIMSELLSNLRGEKRSVMEGMLETTRTEALRETFNKLLPVVLSETARKSAPAPTGRKPLIEDRTASRSVVVTGDQRTNRLYETAQAETEIDNEIAQVVRLAGIKQ